MTSSDAFISYCNKLSPLTKEATADLLQADVEKKYKKDDYLLRQDETCKYIYFISKGLAKSFFSGSSKEFIVRFFSEGMIFSVFDSFTPQTPSNYSMIALEDTIVNCISFEAMEVLCKDHHCIETLFRKLLSIASVKMMKRIREMLEESATERYNQFLEENSNIIQRISLGDLAKYLGITQQSLSRIRTVR